MMDGGAVDVDWEPSPPYNGVKTLVLVGRTGNGKSASGKTIFGRKAFASRASSSGVTRACELQQAVLHDGQIVNVIGTPGIIIIDFSEYDVLRGSFRAAFRIYCLVKFLFYAVVVEYQVDSCSNGTICGRSL